MAHLKPPVESSDHQTGNNNAQVTLVEYGDYQCSHCAHAYPLVKQLLEEKGDDFQFIFRNFPLRESHPLAELAARAAEAAGEQHQFWEMHDKIYEHQRELREDSFEQFARELRLDLNQFSSDMKSDEIASKVERDFESGIRSGVNGTPSFFINGEKLNSYDGSYKSLKQALSS
ncbi:DsbA family protein [Pontibacter chitinilyticus]|uniref:DsbA family protein n=1 Tax=Pontibacter chitinilyticus TaxID=2674989 RepID=UPI00321C16B4